VKFAGGREGISANCLFVYFSAVSFVLNTKNCWLNILAQNQRPNYWKLQQYCTSCCGFVEYNNNNNNDRLTAFDPGQPG